MSERDFEEEGHMRRIPGLSLLAALPLAITGLTAASLTMPVSASAAVGCTAADAAIYQAPATVSGSAGSILACTPTTLSQVPGSIPMQAWKVQYATTDWRGRPAASSGFVAVPSAPWLGPGSRPVVSFHFGTLGLGPQCAFSKQLSGAYQDEYEGDEIAAILKAGWAVAATDDIGYLDGQTHTYMTGANSGHATLDAVRAAFNLPGTGLSRSTKVALWGYSQGGAASLWAAQLAGSYAPELNVAGAAAGGVPADLRAVAAGTSSMYQGFTIDATIGMAVSHPNLPFDSLLNDKGKQTVATLKTVCLLGTVAAGNGLTSQDLTVGGLSLDQLYARAGSDGITWGQVVDAQKLGVGVGRPGSGATYRISFPVLQFHGLLDQVIPPAVEAAVKTAYCQSSIVTDEKLYLADHTLTESSALSDVVSWLSARFAGTPTTGSC